MRVLIARILFVCVRCDACLNSLLLISASAVCIVHVRSLCLRFLCLQWPACLHSSPPSLCLQFAMHVLISSSPPSLCLQFAMHVLISSSPPSLCLQFAMHVLISSLSPLISYTGVSVRANDAEEEVKVI